MNLNDFACVCACCACVVHVCAVWDAWGVPSDAWHSNGWDKMGTMCIHTNTEQNMINMINQDKNQALKLIWVQFNTRMSLRHFFKHLACNSEFQLWTMHEHGIICLNTSLECLKGPTQIHKHQMGFNPIKDFEEFSQKLRTPTQFLKIPNFWTLTLIST